MKILAVWTLSATQLFADTNLPEVEAIPPLYPPRPEIPPGFWEQHGVAVIVAGVLFAGAGVGDPVHASGNMLFQSVSAANQNEQSLSS